MCQSIQLSIQYFSVPCNVVDFSFVENNWNIKVVALEYNYQCCLQSQQTYVREHLTIMCYCYKGCG